MLIKKDFENFKKILLELDKLQPKATDLLGSLNEFELFLLKKISKEKQVNKSDIINFKFKSRAQKYRGIKKLIDKNLIIDEGKYLKLAI